MSDLTLESCDEQVIRFQWVWNQCLCGHLLPYGMSLVLEMLRVFWSCCHVFSCGLLHCRALDTESLLEQANLYMKEMPLSDLNSALELVVCYGVNCSTCWMILFSTDGNMKYDTIHWYMNYEVRWSDWIVKETTRLFWVTDFEFSRIQVPSNLLILDFDFLFFYITQARKKWSAIDFFFIILEHVDICLGSAT